MDISEENANITNEVRHLVVGTQGKLISDYAMWLFQWICGGICQVIAIFGVVTNIINLKCFIKQGFKDPVNVTLFGLAISDLGCLLAMIWLNICLLPLFQEADLPFDTDVMSYLGAGWPHAIFNRVTSFLTAFITLERCICIALPLKVTGIFTSKRVFVVVVSIFMILIATASPIYYVNRFAMVFSLSKNKTILGIVYAENRQEILTASVAVNNVILPFGAFAVIIVCTTVLVVCLHRKTKWRQSATTANSQSFHSRDQKVSKMILIISTTFIFCFIPSVVSCLAMTIELRIDMYGQYKNTFMVLFGISFILETANSSVNIFVYYSMSSKFRVIFRELFGIQNDVKRIENFMT